MRISFVYKKVSKENEFERSKTEAEKVVTHLLQMPREVAGARSQDGSASWVLKVNRF